jgi:DNA-binding NtrC family response regulator
MAKGLRHLMREYEKHLVQTTLKANGMDKARTAMGLQISRRALDKILERHRLVQQPRYARPLPIPRFVKPEEG